MPYQQLLDSESRKPVGRNRPIAASAPQKQSVHELEASYRSWKERRPQLYHQRSTPTPMASNTKVCIFVIADGESQPVKLSNAVHDSKLSKSIISRSQALATRGPIRSIPSTTLTDQAGATYGSKSTISLRWYYDGTYQSSPETFYIVDNLSDTYEAALRKSAETSVAANAPQVNAYQFDPRTRNAQPDPRTIQLRIDNKRKVEQQVEAEKKMVRDKFMAQASKPVVKRG